MRTYEQHEKAILKVIEKSRESKSPNGLIMFFTDIFDHYGGLRERQFFNLGLHESQSIKNALEQNKLLRCNQKKRDWLNDENATLQLAGYKLICTDEERNKLATTVKADAKLDANHKVQISFDEGDEG